MIDKAMKDSLRQFSRNERWGTCISCPRDSEHNAYPEFCENTQRHDHKLNMNQLADAYNSDTPKGERA